MLALAVVASCGDRGVLSDAEREAIRERVREDLAAERGQAAGQRSEALALAIAEGERIRRIIDEDGPGLRREVRGALVASQSDFPSGPEDALTEAACDLVKKGLCSISDFAEWGWARSQNAETRGRYYTYCQRPASLAKHWAIGADGTPVL